MTSREEFLKGLASMEDSPPDREFVAYARELQRIVDQVDDVLVINWVGPRKDGDYRKSLAELVEMNTAYTFYCAMDGNRYFYDAY